MTAELQGLGLSHVVTSHADLACLSMLCAGRYVSGRRLLCLGGATSMHGISVIDSQQCNRMGPPDERIPLISA